MREAIRPLDEVDILELQLEGHDNMVVKIGGHWYNRDDLYHCSDCTALTPDPTSIDDEGHCRSCAKEAKDTESQYNQQWDHFARVL